MQHQFEQKSLIFSFVSQSARLVEEAVVAVGG